MDRVLTTILFVALSVDQAVAQSPYVPCPNITIGWSLSFPPPITAVQYDTSSMLLYVIFNGTTASAYSNVPLSVIQGFSRAGVNPVSYYNSNVVGQYHPLWLAQTNNCPLLFENGAYIWSQ